MTALLAVENLASVVQFPLHTIAGNEEGTGTEAFRFATLRRRDHWSPTTPNADAWLKITFDRQRAWNFICLWDHNLAGETLRAQGSNDDFTGIETAFDGVIPTTWATGSVDDALGVVTQDQMWLKRVPLHVSQAARLYVPAMGTGLVPRLNGIVGLAYAFDRDRGEMPESSDLMTEELRTEAGYVGRGVLDVPRSGTMRVRMPNLLEWETARYHLVHRYARSPGVLIFDEARADEGMMVMRPTGRQAPQQSRDYFYPQVELPYTEWDQREVGT